MELLQTNNSVIPMCIYGNKCPHVEQVKNKYSNVIDARNNCKCGFVHYDRDFIIR